jgi:hypothetical protein
MVAVVVSPVRRPFSNSSASTRTQRIQRIPHACWSPYEDRLKKARGKVNGLKGKFLCK